VDSKEGCSSFPDKLPIIVPRSRLVTVKYRVLARPYDGILSPEKTEEFSGQLAFIFQHEMDHFEAKYVFDV
jgi:peptide deformylase